MSNLRTKMNGLNKTAGYGEVLDGIKNLLRQEIINIIGEKQRSDNPDDVLEKVIDVFNRNSLGRGNSLESYVSTLISIIEEYGYRGNAVFEMNYFN